MAQKYKILRQTAQGGLCKTVLNSMFDNFDKAMIACDEMNYDSRVFLYIPVPSDFSLEKYYGNSQK